MKGKAEVKIDPDFAKTVDLKTRYHVFVTPHSTKISALAVVARLPGRFRVEHPGGASGSFSYRVVDKRADMRVRRLERVKMPAPKKVASAERADRICPDDARITEHVRLGSFASLRRVARLRECPLCLQ